MLPYMAWFALLYGPQVPSSVTARDLLAKALEWERRAGPAGEEGLGQEEGMDPDPTAEGADQVEGLDGAGEPDAPPTLDERRDRAVAAAIELTMAWQDDVMTGVPSQFVLALGGVADRAAYLLDEVAPELATEAVSVRDIFMRHSQYGDRRSREELEGAVDRLEALLDATIRLAFELYTLGQAPPRAPSWG